MAVCRWLYNKFVKQAKKSFLSRNDMNYFLTELKQSEPWLYNYYSKMLQMVSTQIESAEKSLIKLNKKGYKTGTIKFAIYNEYRTFTYNQSGFKFEKRGDKTLLHLSKIGYVEIRRHRKFPDNANIKQVIVTKSKSGKWYACLTCDIVESLFNIPKIDFKKSVGIDVGIKSFTYDSDGCSTPNPLNLKKMLKPLARAQRKVSRRKKGSNNRLKAIRHLQKIHEIIANRRKDFQHKLSTQYAKNNDVVFVEKLEKLNMVKNRRLSRSIMDSSWGMFLQKLEYKCKLLVEVSSQNTTIDCSRCGNKVPKGLTVRIHRCGKCNLVIDRDYNASINILQKGLKIFGQDNLPQELWKVTPVEISMRSVKQEQIIQRFR
ncbi:transposase [Candidatus Nitrosopumilus koreensis AR1]|uniref:Transposase n=1 Tax=Candidatus Nitrosopumilus koreensis AR1 TaxID=1229908 RepID=K0B514_9ARCH|nr:transposase [Candidatus Nitrosopumilus koreensis AR1]